MISPIACPSAGTSVSLASTTRNSLPGNAYPVIDCPTYFCSPCHSRPAFMGDIESEGDVSVKPYPEKHSQPSFSSTSRTRVGEDAAPPMTMRRRLLKL